LTKLLLESPLEETELEEEEMFESSDEIEDELLNSNFIKKKTSDSPSQDEKQKEKEEEEEKGAKEEEAKEDHDEQEEEEEEDIFSDYFGSEEGFGKCLDDIDSQSQELSSIGYDDENSESSHQNLSDEFSREKDEDLRGSEVQSDSSKRYENVLAIVKSFSNPSFRSKICELCEFCYKLYDEIAPINDTPILISLLRTCVGLIQFSRTRNSSLFPEFCSDEFTSLSNASLQAIFDLIAPLFIPSFSPKNPENIISLQKSLNSIIFSPHDEEFSARDDLEFLHQSHFVITPSTKINIEKLTPAIIAGTPICIVGEALSGKSALANYLGEKRKSVFQPIESYSSSKIERFQCNQNSEKESLFGSLSLSNSFSYELGPLSKAIQNGWTFILEDAHLLEPSVLQQIANVLSVLPGQRIPLPNSISKCVRRHINFTFICTTRKPLESTFPYIPHLFIEKFNIKDIASICDFYKSHCNVGMRYCDKISLLLSQLIEKNETYSYSVKDINTILLRISYLERTNCFDKCLVDEFGRQKFLLDVVPARIATLLLVSTIPIAKRDELCPNIFSVIDDVFGLIDSKFLNSKEWLDSEVTVEKLHQTIQKGCLSIPFSAPVLSQSSIHPRILQLLYSLECTAPNEHILLVGETCYKSKALSDWLNNIPSKDCNIPLFEFSRESEISSILGAEQLHTLKQVEETYKSMEEFLKNIEEEGEIGSSIMFEYIQQLKKMKRKKEKDLKASLAENGEDISAASGFNKYCMNFVPASLLCRASIGRPVLIKNIALPPASVVESLCPLLHPNGPIFDIPKTIFFQNRNGSPKSIPNWANHASRGERFVLYATCHPQSYDKLSPAIRTRMTVMHVNSYNTDDRKLVISNQFIHNMKKYPPKQRLDHSEMLKLETILLEIYEKASDYISIAFRSLILWVDSTMAMYCQKGDSQTSPTHCVSYAFVRSVVDGLEDDTRDSLIRMLWEDKYLPDSFLEIIPDRVGKELCSKESSSIGTFNDFFTIKLLKQKHSNRFIHIKSKVSQISFNFPVSKKYTIPKSIHEFIFVPTLVHMLDAFLTAATCNCPVFIEAAPGIGKSACAQVIAELLDLPFKRFNFSNSTSLDDLFGRYQSFNEKNDDGTEGVLQFKRGEGALLSAIGTNEQYSPVSYPTRIILFDETNLAPPEVLDVLLPMCSMTNRNVTCPDGSIIDCSHVLVFATLNPANISGSRNPIPQSLQQSVFYLNVPQYSNEELLQIAQKKLASLPNVSTNAVSQLIHAHATTMLFTKKLGNTDYSSLREIIKVSEIYLAAIEANAPLSFEFVLDLVYFSRFDPTMRSELLRNAKLPSFSSGMMDLQPFRQRTEDSRLLLQIGRAKIDCTNWLSPTDRSILGRLPPGQPIPIQHSLSSQQLVVMEKIGSIIPTKRAILLLGGSGSGKSFLVETMAKLCGKKLHVIQLNSESDIGSIVGRLEPTPPSGQEKLTNTIVKTIQSVLQGMMAVKTKKSTREKFLRLQRYIPALLNPNFAKRKATLIECSLVFPQFKIPLEECEIFLQKAKANFKFIKSTLIKAMEDGDFFLLDNLQAAPSDVCERLNSLIEENQRLYLFEKDSETVYVENPTKPGEKQISKDFRLFMTADPNRVGAHAIPPSFMSRCIAISTSSLVPKLQSSHDSSISEQIAVKNLVEIAGRSLFNDSGVFANKKQLSLDFGAAIACAFANMYKLWTFSPPSSITTQFSVRSFFHTLKSFDIIVRKQKLLPPHEQCDHIAILKFVLFHHYEKMSDDQSYRRMAQQSIIEKVVTGYSALKTVNFCEKHDHFIELERNIASFEHICLNSLIKEEDSQDLAKKLFCYVDGFKNSSDFIHIDKLRNGKSGKNSGRFERLLQLQAPQSSLNEKIQHLRTIIMSLLNDIIQLSISKSDFNIRYSELKTFTFSYCSLCAKESILSDLVKEIGSQLFPTFIFTDYVLRQFSSLQMDMKHDKIDDENDENDQGYNDRQQLKWCIETYSLSDSPKNKPLLPQSFHWYPLLYSSIQMAFEILKQNSKPSKSFKIESHYNAISNALAGSFVNHQCVDNLRREGISNAQYCGILISLYSRYFYYNPKSKFNPFHSLQAILEIAEALIILSHHGINNVKIKPRLYEREKPQPGTVLIEQRESKLTHVLFLRDSSNGDGNVCDNAKIKISPVHFLRCAAFNLVRQSSKLKKKEKTSKPHKISVPNTAFDREEQKKLPTNYLERIPKKNDFFFPLAIIENPKKSRQGSKPKLSQSMQLWNIRDFFSMMCFIPQNRCSLFHHLLDPAFIHPMHREFQEYIHHSVQSLSFLELIKSSCYRKLIFKMPTELLQISQQINIDNYRLILNLYMQKEEFLSLDRKDPKWKSLISKIFHSSLQQRVMQIRQLEDCTKHSKGFFNNFGFKSMSYDVIIGLLDKLKGESDAEQFESMKISEQTRKVGEASRQLRKKIDTVRTQLPCNRAVENLVQMYERGLAPKIEKLIQDEHSRNEVFEGLAETIDEYKRKCENMSIQLDIIFSDHFKKDQAMSEKKVELGVLWKLINEQINRKHKLISSFEVQLRAFEKANKKNVKFQQFLKSHTPIIKNQALIEFEKILHDPSILSSLTSDGESSDNDQFILFYPSKVVSLMYKEFLRSELQNIHEHIQRNSIEKERLQEEYNSQKMIIFEFQDELSKQFSSWADTLYLRAQEKYERESDQRKLRECCKNIHEIRKWWKKGERDLDLQHLKVDFKVSKHACKVEIKPGAKWKSKDKQCMFSTFFSPFHSLSYELIKSRWSMMLRDTTSFICIMPKIPAERSIFQSIQLNGADELCTELPFENIPINLENIEIFPLFFPNDTYSFMRSQSRYRSPPPPRKIELPREFLPFSEGSLYEYYNDLLRVINSKYDSLRKEIMFPCIEKNDLKKSEAQFHDLEKRISVLKSDERKIQDILPEQIYPDFSHEIDFVKIPKFSLNVDHFQPNPQIINSSFNCESIFIPLKPIISGTYVSGPICTVKIENFSSLNNITFAYQKDDHSPFSPLFSFSLKYASAQVLELRINFNCSSIPVVEKEQQYLETHHLCVDIDESPAILPISLQCCILPNLICIECDQGMRYNKDKLVAIGPMPLNVKYHRPRGYPNHSFIVQHIQAGYDNKCSGCHWNLNKDAFQFQSERGKGGDILALSDVKTCSLPSFSVYCEKLKSSTLRIFGFYQSKKNVLSEMKIVEFSTRLLTKRFRVFIWNGTGSSIKTSIKLAKNPLKAKFLSNGYKNEMNLSMKNNSWNEIGLQVDIPTYRQSIENKWNIHILDKNQEILFCIKVVYVYNSKSNNQIEWAIGKVDNSPKKEVVSKELDRMAKVLKEEHKKQLDAFPLDEGEKSPALYYKNRKPILSEEFDRYDSSCKVDLFTPKLSFSSMDEIEFSAQTLRELQDLCDVDSLKLFSGIHALWMKLLSCQHNLDRCVFAIQRKEAEEKQRLLEIFEEYIGFLKSFSCIHLVPPLKQIIELKFKTISISIDQICSISTPTQFVEFHPFQISSGDVQFDSIHQPSIQNSNSISKSQKSNPIKPQLNVMYFSKPSKAQKAKSKKLHFQSTSDHQSQRKVDIQHATIKSDQKLSVLTPHDELELLEVLGKAQMFSLDVFDFATDEQLEKLKEAKDLTLETVISKDQPKRGGSETCDKAQNPDEYYSRTLSILSSTYAKEKPWAILPSLEVSEIVEKEDLIKLISFDKKIEKEFMGGYLKEFAATFQSMIDKITGFVCEKRMEGTISYDKTDVVLAVDIHKYLKEEKLLVIHLVFLLALSLHNLKLRYSIVLFGDRFNQFVVKRIDEPHSEMALQRFLDAYFGAESSISFPLDVFQFIHNSCGFHDDDNDLSISSSTRGKFSTILISPCLSLQVINPSCHKDGQYSWNTHMTGECLDIIVVNLLKEASNRTNLDLCLQNISDTHVRIHPIDKIDLSRIFLETTHSLYHKHEIFGDLLCKSLNRKLKPKRIIEKSCSTFMESLSSNVRDLPSVVSIESLNVFHTATKLKSMKKVAFQGEESEIFYIDNGISSIKPSCPVLRSEAVLLPKNEDLHPIISKICNTEGIDLHSLSEFHLVTSHAPFINSQASTLGNLIKPNKATSMISSNSGSEIDFHKLFMALMGSMETKIFKRKAGNKIRVYSISLVLDLSPSSICEVNVCHTFFSFVFALHLLSRLSIPHVDVILCSDRPYLVFKDERPENIIKPTSSLWPIICHAYTLAIDYKSDVFAQGIVCALSLQSNRTCPSALFSLVSQKSIWCFSDGILDPLSRCIIHSCQARAYVVDVDIIGIGVGIQGSICLQDTFQKCCFSLKPDEIGEALCCLYNPKSTKSKKANFSVLYSTPQCTFDSKSILERKPWNGLLSDSIRMHCNRHKSRFASARLNHKAFSEEAIGEGRTDNIDGADLYLDGAFSGFSILVCMFYFDCEADINEDVFINGKSHSGSSPYNSMKQKGFSVTITKDYISSIRELRSGKHSICMIISSTGTSSCIKDTSHLSEFIQTVDKYWKLGGSLFLWVDNAPFFHEVNLFLAQAVFETERGSIPCKFRMEGNYIGQKFFSPKLPVSGELQRGCFNAEKFITVGSRQIPAFRGGLRKIFEGITIALFTQRTREGMYPFVPFAMNTATDHMYSPAIAYHISNPDYTSQGSIIIDSAFTKLYFNYDEAGTARWIINAICLLAERFSERKFDMTKETESQMSPFH
ncbi:hypothetical protein ADUPG1_008580, partial [Aduncisulcus paluster]